MHYSVGRTWCPFTQVYYITAIRKLYNFYFQNSCPGPSSRFVVSLRRRTAPQDGQYMVKYNFLRVGCFAQIRNPGLSQPGLEQSEWRWGVLAVGQCQYVESKMKWTHIMRWLQTNVLNETVWSCMVAELQIMWLVLPKMPVIGTVRVTDAKKFKMDALCGGHGDRLSSGEHVG